MNNHDIDPATIPEDRRAAYELLVAAHIVSMQAESNEKAANDAVAHRSRIHNDAVAAAPKSSFMDLHKASVAAWKSEH